MVVSQLSVRKFGVQFPGLDKNVQPTQNFCQWGQPLVALATEIHKVKSSLSPPDQCRALPMTNGSP